MKIIEFLESSDFTIDADIVIRKIDDETGEATDVWKSWSSCTYDTNIPFDIAMEDICYITIVNGYCEMYNIPVLVIEY